MFVNGAPSLFLHACSLRTLQYSPTPPTGPGSDLVRSDASESEAASEAEDDVRPYHLQVRCWC